MACDLSDGVMAAWAHLRCLIFDDCRLDSVYGVCAELADNLTLRECHVTAGVRFDSARIGGLVDCSGSWFDAPVARPANSEGPEERIALSFAGAEISDRLVLSGGFTARGQVRLVQATVRRDIDAEDARILNPGGFSISAGGLTVSRDVELSRSALHGECRLVASHIGGDLVCEGTKLLFGRNGAETITLDRASVHGDWIMNGAHVVGEVRAVAARVDGNAEFEGTRFVTDREGASDVLHALFPDTTEPPPPLFHERLLRSSGLIGEYMSVGRRFRWQNVEFGEGAVVSLLNARVGTLVDDNGSWPAPGNLILTGFAYDEISSSPTDIATRLEWVRRSQASTYLPQPYQQLASFYRKRGDDWEVTRVAIEREKRRLKFGHLSKGQKIASGILGVTIAHGYRPGLALAWGGAVILAGWLLFAWGDAAKLLAPVDSTAAVSFSPLIYSFDTFLPVIDLHQADHWLPREGAGELVGGAFRAGTLLRVYHWLHIILGWGLTTLGVIGFTGIARKE
jgi:hypothetical protein